MAAPTTPTRRSAGRSDKVRLAGGEASHNVYMARQLIDYGKVSFVQIDCGRIGGIGPAKEVADYAVAKGVTYVNHTFTSHLALAASLATLSRGSPSTSSANIPSRPSRSPTTSRPTI